MSEHTAEKGLPVDGCPRCFIENKPCAHHCDPATCPDPAHVTKTPVGEHPLSATLMGAVEREVLAASPTGSTFDTLVRALCKADGKVYWTPDVPAVYHHQAAALIADGWQFTRVLPPGEGRA